MQTTILIMDDDERRLNAMRLFLSETDPQSSVVCFDNAPDTITFLHRNLSSVHLISLDHDLGPNRERDGDIFDPGCGRDVVDFLNNQ